MPPEEKESLEREARGLNVRLLSQVFDNLNYVMRLILWSPWRVTRIIVEILQLRKKALRDFAPAHGDHKISRIDVIQIVKTWLSKRTLSPRASLSRLSFSSGGIRGRQ